jgi:AcrR family transcriptional regulator
MPAKKKRKPKNKGTKRIPLSREKILEKALEMADSMGVEQITMRSLGKSLGVEAMSLYKHIKNKEDILDGLSDLVLSKIQFPSDQASIRDALIFLCQEKRRVFKLHPWSIPVVESRIIFSEFRFAFMEEQFRILKKVGYDMVQSYRLLLALESYVYGFCIQESNWNFEGLPKDQIQEIQSSWGLNAEDLTEKYPNFFGFLNLFFEKFGSNQIGKMLDEEFLLGLDSLLSKLESKK